MGLLQRKHYIKILFIVSLLIIAYIFITDEDFSYEQITIQEGDTLWTLADRYKGDMTKEQWIRLVTAENNLNGNHIIAGDTLIIPIPKNAIYMAVNEEEIQSIKVARNDYEK
ncbi:LysM peptidoglycan-binding domain-containing protein [Ureibacillus thermophilus]|uniref:cell division suppressor protein YneA n=1 Tax=Ureibacillus thermophilus TaxID=367743 RepID=UPI0036234B74